MLCLFLFFKGQYQHTPQLRGLEVRVHYGTANTSLYHVIKLGQCQGKILILRKSFYATSSCPVCWGGHSIPSVLRASSYPSCPCLGPLLILSHTWYVIDPKRVNGEYRARCQGESRSSVNEGIVLAGPSASQHHSATCKLNFFLVTSNNPCQSFAAPTTIPPHPFLFCTCTTAMSQALTTPQAPKPILSGPQCLFPVQLLL